MSPVILPQLIKQYMLMHVEFIVLDFLAQNKPKMGTSLFGVTMTLKQQEKMETSFFLNGIHFSARKCMFDTLPKISHEITQRPTLKIIWCPWQTSGTVAGPEACPLHLQADPRSTLMCRTFFCVFFPLSLIQEKKLSVTGETEWSLNSKVKNDSRRLA